MQKMNMEKAAQNMQLWTNDVCASEMTPSLYENHEMLCWGSVRQDKWLKCNQLRIFYLQVRATGTFWDLLVHKNIFVSAFHPP